MSTLTIRLPDEKHARLRQLAKHRGISVNKLIEKMATISLAGDPQYRSGKPVHRGGVA